MIATLLLAGVAAQSPPTGNVSVFLDRLPNRDATELRGRAFVEEKIDAGPHVRIAASGFAEGLLARRRTTPGSDSAGKVTDGTIEAQELTVTLRARRVDVTAGLGRVVWGRLDELQP